MIRIHKPKEGPPILRERGKALTEACCRDHERGAPLEFDESVYGHRSVKEALMEAQHGKCCYCEHPIRPSGHGDIEHFRPKRAVRQSDTSPESRPGYYWLAYAWTNLFLSCEVCNQIHKRSLFPLADPTRRARTHTQTLADESPLLLDPAGDDPERSIGFRREVPFGRDSRGAATIQCLKLDRTALCERRADHLAYFKAFLHIVEISERSVERPPEADEALTWLQHMSSDRGAYAAAVRELLRTRLGADLTFPLDSDELRRRVRGGSQQAPPL